MNNPEPLSVRIDALNGNTYTFGARAEDEGSVPYDISWGTQNPGGFADASVTLMRPPWLSAADIPLFADVIIQGSDVKYRGRVRQAPRGDSEAVTLSMEGLAAVLDDNQYYRFLGCHNDLSAWTAPGVSRQLNLTSSGIIPSTDGGTTNDPTKPAISTSILLPLDPPPSVWAEQWLYADGIPIKAVMGSWEVTGPTPIYPSDITWEWYVNFSGDGLFDDEGTGNLNVAGPTTGTFSHTATTATDYIFVQFKGVGMFSTVFGEQARIFWVPSAFGDHGLTPEALPDGRWGLKSVDVLTYTMDSLGIDVETIQDNGFTIPHVVHTGPARELVEYVSAFGTASGRIANWGFYENGFFWSEPDDSQPQWRVNRSQMATTSDEGPTVDQLCRGVVITYTDGAGRQLSVGPVGSAADYETADLEDATAANLAPEGRVKVRDAGLTSQEGAVLIGQALLAESNNQPRKGTVTMMGDIEDAAGNIGHASDVRATDRIVITDDEDPESQNIVSTSYDHNTQTCTANIGIAPANIETLLARLTAVTAGI